MKIIHCADVHLGSKLTSKFPKRIADERRMEVRNSFRRMVEFARAQGVKVILLAGDVFDSDKPYKKDKDFFFSVVENNPDVDFLYLRGNHDGDGESKDLPNLKTFGNEWTYYTYGDTVFAGVEISAQNASSIYSTLNLSADKKNVVLLHGQVGDTSGKDKVNRIKLREKNVDYLALGHIHSYGSERLDKRGVYAYCGCLEGRGFDETGVKGFVLLSVGEMVSHTFVPFSQSPIERVELDVSGVDDAYAAYLLAKRQITFSRDTVYRVELTGEVDANGVSLAPDLQKHLQDECAFVDVKDCTKKKLDWSAYENDVSLKGEFARTVYASADFTEEEKAQIVAYGLRALAGGEIEE